MALTLTYRFGDATGFTKLFTRQLDADLQLLAGKFPASSTDNAIARYDGTTGALQDSGSYIDDSGNIGVRTASPQTALDVNLNVTKTASITAGGSVVARFANVDGTTTTVEYDGYAAAASVNYRRANTSAASPSALAANDIIGQFGWMGYGSTGYSSLNRARIAGLAAEAWSDTAQGTYITFNTTAIGAASFTERVRFDDAGNIQMGGANTVITASRHPQLRSYTVATLPSAATAGQWIYVSDETGGAIPAFSDGTNWRRVTDRAIVA